MPSGLFPGCAIARPGCNALDKRSGPAGASLALGEGYLAVPRRRYRLVLISDYVYGIWYVTPKRSPRSAIVIFVYCSSKIGALLQYYGIRSSPSS
ncbi:hypothetical protein GRJ2_001811600 [Grus japonensis]|uniref:Uncharacterized protein n=1 Tax=Grus japonensis TaxID=30415 RepID=A0ABC9X725_GRUJA